jgi:hypothetical protein
MFKKKWITSPHLELLYNHVHTWANGLSHISIHEYKMPSKYAKNFLQVFFVYGKAQR